MTLLSKFQNTPEKSSSNETDRKWAKRGLGAAAVGLAIVAAGNFIEHLRSDDFIEVDSTQSAELEATNQHLLERVAQLPFDESGHAEKVLEPTPGYKNDLSVTLDVKNDSLTINGQGHHMGHTVQSGTAYNDPASFKLTYKLDQSSTAQVPAELLKQIMNSGRMPEEVQYHLTEKRSGYGRYGDEDGIGDVGSKESQAVMKIGPKGELMAIQIGNKGMAATSNDVTDGAKEAYSDIANELARVGA